MRVHRLSPARQPPDHRAEIARLRATPQRALFGIVARGARPCSVSSKRGPLADLARDDLAVGRLLNAQLLVIDTQNNVNNERDDRDLRPGMRFSNTALSRSAARDRSERPLTRPTCLYPA